MPIWSTTYREHAPGIRAFLRRRLRSEDLAEDLCQETFVRAMGAEDRIRDTSRLRSYLYRIATNLVSNHRRRPDLVCHESDLGEDTELDLMQESREPGPDVLVDADELRRRIEAVLATLPLDQAQAFRWGVLEQMPYAEIRARTGWTASKVKITVFRARKRLIEELADLRDGRT